MRCARGEPKPVEVTPVEQSELLKQFEEMAKKVVQPALTPPVALEETPPLPPAPEPSPVVKPQRKAKETPSVPCVNEAQPENIVVEPGQDDTHK